MCSPSTWPPTKSSRPSGSPRCALPPTPSCTSASRFAIVGVAAALDVSDGVIRSARIGLTGAVSHAVRLTTVEAALAGSDLEDVNEDIHASEAYRRAMIPVFTRRALDGALVRLTAQS